MLGHKSIKSTQIYAKVVGSKISDEMDMFNQTILTPKNPLNNPKKTPNDNVNVNENI